MSFSDLKKKIDDSTAIVSVVGLGYVGLPTAILVAQKGFKVIGIDVDEDKIDSLLKGVSPIKDDFIQSNLETMMHEDRITFQSSFEDGISDSDIVMLILPTPVSKYKDPDLSYVMSGAESVAPYLRKDTMVVFESTTYPGTTDDIIRPILEKGSGLSCPSEFGLVYCPERYNPGDPEHSIDKVDRIIGGISLEWAEVGAHFYSRFVKRVHIVKDLKTAEAAKVIENVQRDLNIALVNELALIFEKMGLDTYEVLDAASTKWNFIRMNPGPGVGGHCLPVDPYYLTYKAREVGFYPKVILAGREINDSMPHHVFRMVSDALNHIHKAVKGSKIAILGIAYKANTDDARESPAIPLIDDLLAKGAKVRVCDDHVSKDHLPRGFSADIGPIENVVENADVVVFLVDHEEFRTIDLKWLHDAMAVKPIFVDTRDLYLPKDVVSAGFIYVGLGRGLME